jgi:riboflavin-specific deaminase-like protein
MRRLLPNPGPTSIDEELAGYNPFEDPLEERPFVAVNMVTTLDGRASLNGRTVELGKQCDIELLLKLRTRFDAVMIGAGTMRAERYGRIVKDPDARAAREQIGLPPDPLAVIISGRLELPFDAPLFTDGGGRVLIFTAAADAEPPPTATPVRVVRHQGSIDLVEALRYLREERGIRAALCEGGPRLHGELQAAGLVDDLFLTIAPKLGGGGSPRIVEGDLPGVAELELGWLLEKDGELFARYRRR